MSTDHDLLKLARVVSAAGLGVSAGIMSTIPFVSVPVLFNSNLSAEMRLRTWRVLFEHVVAFMAPYTVSLGLLGGAVAYHAVPPPVAAPGGGSWWSVNRKAILTASALCDLALAPLSIFFLYPVGDRIKAIEQSLAKMDEGARTAAAREGDALLKKEWAPLYVAKVALGLAALGLAAGELGYA
ncbi:hypothetical protein JCM8547_001347 [Rhodosporidiobolus lusitaniae]